MSDNRIDEVIESINVSGIEISEYKPVRGGINSQVYKLKDSVGNIYALKLYPKSSSFDSVNRYQSELNFIALLLPLLDAVCIVAGQDVVAVEDAVILSF